MGVKPDSSMANTIIRNLFDEWNQALQTGDPKQVTALYENHAIFLPTLSNQVRHNRNEIEDYFVYFLSRGPRGQINESNIRIFGDIAVNSGVYTFTFKDGTSIPARFTFIYRWNEKRWMIVEHHSSIRPE
ncbi:SgcJ/EcaC family oxidoreductase [Burkholderiales bacterium]|nr:SgcJ/EcaC family oxidoreductase [Burkholderiales bacterium]